MTVKHEEYLAHYGVKGMRWGIRKDRRRDSSKRLTRKERRAVRRKEELSKRSVDRRVVDNPDTGKNKKAKYMSNEELTAAINRLNLEIRYNELAMEVYYPGMRYAKDFVIRNGNKTADKLYDKNVLSKIKG